MSLPESKERAEEAEATPAPEQPQHIGTFAVARSASERDTFFNTLEVGPRWSFSS